MINKTIWLTILFFSTLLSAKSNAPLQIKLDNTDVTYEVVPNKLPIEFALLFETNWNGHYYSLYKTDRTLVMHNIYNADRILRLIDHQTIKRLTIAEIGKYFFSLKEVQNQIISYDPTIIRDFFNFFQDNREKMSSLELLVSQRTYNDLQSFFSSPLFNKINSQLLTLKKIKNRQLKSFKQQLTQVVKLSTFLLSLDASERKSVFYDAAKEIFANIITSAQLFLQYTHPEALEQDPVHELTLFRIKQSSDEIASIVDEIIQDIKKEKSRQKPTTKPSKPREKFTIDWKNLPLIPKPFEYYEAPKSLPQPLNDWIKDIPAKTPTHSTALTTETENDNLLLAPDPNYQPPKELPTPLGPPGVWPEE